MKKKFKVQFTLTIESKDYPVDKMREFAYKLFKGYFYKSMITKAVTDNVIVMEIEE
jgi:hypothetical protein